MHLTIDSREPDPHPWIAHLPEGWTAEIATLETGDLCLAGLPDGVAIERKTPGDLAGCIGASRERFERELKRSRYIGRFIVVCEGTLTGVCQAARGIHRNAIIGTLSAWTVRYCPIVFCGTVEAAADFSFRALQSQVRDIQRKVKAVA